MDVEAEEDMSVPVVERSRQLSQYRQIFRGIFCIRDTVPIMHFSLSGLQICLYFKFDRSLTNEDLPSRNNFGTSRTYSQLPITKHFFIQEFCVVTVLDPDWIRIPDGKNDPQNSKKLINFIFLNAGCSLLRAEGFLKKGYLKNGLV